MEEEDKDAFQEEERAGESFLQPSSKSRSEKILQKKVKKAGTKITLPKEDFKKQVRIEKNLVQ